MSIPQKFRPAFLLGCVGAFVIHPAAASASPADRSAPPPPVAAQRACLTAPVARLAAGEVAFDDGAHRGGPSCVAVAAPSAGVLLLDAALSAPPRAEHPHAEPRLDVYPCGRGPWPVLGRTPSSALLEVAGAGTVVACVAPQDPDHHRDAARLLRTAHAAAPKNQEIEVEPEGQRAPEPKSAHKNQEIEVEPEGSATARLAGHLCASLIRGEHGDVDLCASPLLTGERVDAALEPKGRDVFAVELRALDTVRVELTGDVLIELVDERGLRLARGAGSPDGAAIVKRLPAGLYVLRVDGARGAASPLPYSLRFDVESRRR